MEEKKNSRTTTETGIKKKTENKKEENKAAKNKTTKSKTAIHKSNQEQKTSKNSSSSAKSNTINRKGSRQTGKKNIETTQRDIILDEVCLVITLLISLLLILSYINLCGPVGSFLNMIIFGFMGVLGYLFPFLLFFGVAFHISNRGNRVARRKLIAGIALVFVLTSFIQLISGFDKEKKIIEYFTSAAEKKSGGGVLGCLLLKILYPSFGAIAAAIILTALLLICFMLITGKTIFSYINKLKEFTTGYFEAIEEEEEFEIEEESAPYYEKEFNQEKKNRRSARIVTLKSEEDLEDLEELENIEYKKEDSALTEKITFVDSLKQKGGKGKKAKKSEKAEIIPETIETQSSTAVSEFAHEIEDISDKEKPKITITGDYLRTDEIQDNEVKRSENDSRIYEEELRKKFGINQNTSNLTQPKELEQEIINQKITVPMSEIFPDIDIIPEEENIVETTQRVDIIQTSKEEMTDYDYLKTNFDNEQTMSEFIPEATEFISETAAANSMITEKDSDEKIIPSIQKEFIQIRPLKMQEDILAEKEYFVTEETLTKEEFNIDKFQTQEFKLQESKIQEQKAQDRKIQEQMIQKSQIQKQNQEIQRSEIQDSKMQESKTGKQIIEETSIEEIPIEEKPYEFPPIDLLSKPHRNAKGMTDIELKETAQKLQSTLDSFGVKVTVTNVSCGPAVTRYELQPEQGVKVSKITSLSDDIKLNLAASDIRIEAPISGKAAVGIEVPNKETSSVPLREILEQTEFKEYSSNIAFAVGKDISGQAVVTDIAKMPHLLIAGATGSGKSVCINTLIMSILYKANPADVRLIMVDPKVVELSIYNGIPHLLIPVVTDPKKASAALNWAVMEMTERYNKFAELGVRDLKGYNEKIAEIAELNDPKYQKMPQIVIIVDELADLMMVASNEVETAICRLAQMARAAGLHLIIATQRPSVNVITGVIKANVPSRIAFAVSSAVDSRTIIDSGGAESLLGKGDMLFFPSGIPKPIRVQGAFVSDKEVSAVVDFLKQQNSNMAYSDKISQQINNASEGGELNGTSLGSNRDDYFIEAGKFMIEKDKASIGMLQRVYKIGFNRAARIMDQLAEAGVVGPEEGTKPRKILMSMEEFEQYIDDYL